jgi:hypothetical protein
MAAAMGSNPATARVAFSIRRLRIPSPKRVQPSAMVPTTIVAA